MFVFPNSYFTENSRWMPLTVWLSRMRHSAPTRLFWDTCLVCNSFYWHLPLTNKINKLNLPIPCSSLPKEEGDVIQIKYHEIQSEYQPIKNRVTINVSFVTLTVSPSSKITFGDIFRTR